jgi:branched-chain amino acid transport system substrate-binding protein
MKARIAILAVILAVAVFAAAMHPNVSGMLLLSQPAKEPVKIGVICAQTGPIASSVAASQEGVRMALEDWKTLGKGTDFELIFEDHAGDPKNAITAFNKLKAVDNVSGIITDISSITKALAPLAQETKTPMVSYISTSIIAKEKGDYAFRTSPMNYSEVELMADYMVKKGVTRAAIITELNDYPISMKKLFIEKFSSDGGTITAQEDVAPGKDYRTVLEKIRASDPQAIVIIPISASLALEIITEIKESGIAQDIYGSDILGSLMVLNKAGPEAYSNIVFGAQKYESGKVAELKARYIKKYGKEDVLDWLYLATSYDATMIMFSAIESEGTNPGKIRDYIKAAKYEGISGKISFDQFGDPQESEFALYRYDTNKERALVYEKD